MATNNVGVETHYTQHMNRPTTTTTADSESYQQLNYQTFQMLVVSVVDQLNSKIYNKIHKFIFSLFVFLCS